MKEPIYKDWQEWDDEDGFVKVDAQEEQLELLSTYNAKYEIMLSMPYTIDSAVNYILVPNVQIIKEYNTTFVELMMNHSHKYNTRRIIPIHIIRALIDVGAALTAYMVSPDKKTYAKKYHDGVQFDKIDKSHITKYVKELNKDYPFILELYKECCNYVHTNYVKTKANSTFDSQINPGRIGFLGVYYKVKHDDFINDLVDGAIHETELPFDYEEEVDIIGCCIKVNNMLLDLVKKVIDADYKQR